MSLYVVKAKKTTLKANLSASDVTVTLTNLVDSKGNAIAMASFGEFGVIVIKQGDTIEILKFDDITQNANGSATLDVATNGRNISPITPYGGNATGSAFNAGAEVIVTNDPLTMSRFGMLDNANTWDETQTFTQVPSTTGGNAVSDNQLVRKLQLDQAVLGITTSVKIVVDGTAGETLTAGNLIYLKSSDNRWWKTDADDPATVNNVILGIAQGAGTAGNLITSGILLRGVDANQTGLTAGVKYYASNTAGGISTSAGTTEVTVGISKSTTELYFDPRFDQQLTEDQQDAIENANSPTGANPFLVESDASATPTPNKIAMYDGNGDLAISKIIKQYVIRENVSAGEALCLYPYQSDGGVLIDTTSSGLDNTGGSVSIGNNANRGVLVFASASNATNPTATFGGVAMTAVQVVNTRITAFYVVAPATGSQTLTLSTNCAWTLYSLYGVAQSQPEASAQSNNGSSIALSTIADGATIFTGLGTGQDNVSGFALTGVGGFGGGLTAGNTGGSVATTLSVHSGQVFRPRSISTTITNGGFGTGEIILSIAPATAPTYGSAYKTSASTSTLSQFQNKYSNFLGFANEAGTAGDTIDVVVGGVMTGLTSLSAQETYYLANTAGTIAVTAGTNSKKIGQSQSTTTLNIIQSI